MDTNESTGRIISKRMNESERMYISININEPHNIIYQCVLVNHNGQLFHLELMS